MKLFIVLSSLTLSFAFANANKTLVSSDLVEPNNSNGYPDYETKGGYIVTLYFRRDGSNAHTLCEGSIIANNWVLTAAQCLHNQNNVVIYYGSNSRSSDQLIQIVHSNFFIQHPRWQANNNGSDIGLIRTPHVNFNNGVNKVRLPSFNQRQEQFVYWLAEACGWGGQPNGQLQCIEYKCPSIYRNFPYDELLCGSTSKGSNVCGGKSGGPLLRKTNPPILEGIILADFNKICIEESLTRFTRITVHLDWIQQHTVIAYY